MKTPEARIAVLAIHIGTFPGTMPMWLTSVARNPGIRFILITDQALNNPPENLNIITKSLSEIQDLISESLGTKVSLARPYKLCDYRPMYGLVFASLFEGYDFWGHCDLDVAFGRVNHFLTEEVLRHDKILVRGNFSLYRNVPHMNNLFRYEGASVNWKEVAETEANCLFDEWRGIYRIARACGVSIYQEEIISDINPMRWHLLSNDLTGCRRELHYWQAGALYRSVWNGSSRTDEERLLIHLQKRQYKQDVANLADNEVVAFLPDRCAVVKKDDISVEYAKKMNKRNILKDAEILRRRILRKLSAWSAGLQRHLKISPSVR